MIYVYYYEGGFTVWEVEFEGNNSINKCIYRTRSKPSGKKYIFDIMHPHTFVDGLEKIEIYKELTDELKAQML